MKVCSSNNDPLRSQVSSFTDSRVLGGVNHTESTKLIHTLRADEVGLSTAVTSTANGMLQYQVASTLLLTIVVSNHFNIQIGVCIVLLLKLTSRSSLPSNLNQHQSYLCSCLSASLHCLLL